MKSSDTVVRAALDAYGLADARLERLGGLGAVNFSVEAGDGRRYVLRLYDPQRDDRATVASEHLWLAHLAADTGLALPLPVANRDGDSVTIVTDDSGRGRVCALTQWVEGEAHVGAPGEEHLEQAGRAMARLHASRFVPPPGFVRPTFDGPHVARCLERLRSQHHHELAPDHGEALLRGTRLLEALLERLPKSPTRYGLIHADFHPGNYLVHGGELRIIDFGRCAFGFHALDIAIALEVEAPLRDAFLVGYTSIRPLPSEFVRHEPAFTAMAHLDNLAFLTTRPAERPFVADALPRVAEAFVRWVAEAEPG